MKVTFEINGAEKSVDVEPRTLLSISSAPSWG